jgi:hypothetical protein
LADEVIYNFATLLQHFRIDRLRHVEVLLDRLRFGTDGGSLVGLGGVRTCCILESSAHPHFLLEVNFRERIAFLTVFDFSVAFVDEVITGSDVVMTVIFNALLSIFGFELVLLEEAVEKLFIHWHLFFAWEETHISVSVLHLEGPGV